MTPQEVAKHYKTSYRFHVSTGMSHNTLANWLASGYVPFKSQKKIEQLTEGVLTAVWDDREPYFPPRK